MNTLIRLALVGALVVATVLPTPVAAEVFFTTDSGLSPQEQARIRAAHAQALQAVEDALAYLQGTGFYVLTGNDQRYNNVFGQFYDNSAANPLAGQYFNTTSVRRVSSTSTYLATNITSNQTNGTGTLTFPTGTTYQGDILGEIYVRVPFELYDSRDVDPNNFGGIATVNTLTTAQVNTGTGQNQQTRTELRNIQYQRFPPFELPFVPTGPRVVHPVTGTAELVDSTRFNELVDTMELIRDALLSDVTYDGWQNNANGILATLSQSTGFLPDGTNVTRGFEQYGFSNSDSALHQQNLLDLRLGLTTDILQWWEDFTDADSDGIPDADSPFFNDKFTVLSQGGTIYLGDAALTETQTAGGLFDNSIQTGTSPTDELYKLIIQAIADDVGGGDLSYNREEIAAFLGDANVDPYTGDVFPQDLDVNAFANFADINASITQGGTVGAQAFGPPPGHIAFASPFGLDLLIPRN